MNQLSALARSLRRNPLALAGIVIIAVLVFCAAFGPLLAPRDPDFINLAVRLQPPSMHHLFGTDELGREFLSRILFGSRITLEIVALVAIIAAPVGLVVGTSAGYAGGVLDSLLMRVTDVFLAFPKLVLALALVAAHHGSDPAEVERQKAAYRAAQRRRKHSRREESKRRQACRPPGRSRSRGRSPDAPRRPRKRKPRRLKRPRF